MLKNNINEMSRLIFNFKKNNNINNIFFNFEYYKDNTNIVYILDEKIKIKREQFTISKEKTFEDMLKRLIHNCVENHIYILFIFNYTNNQYTNTITYAKLESRNTYE